MSGRRENESPQHRTSAPLNLPPPPAPPMSAPGMLQNVRFPPAEYGSPEVTQPPNPLQRLMYQQQQEEAQRFLRQFLSNGAAGPQGAMPMPPPPPPPPAVQLMTPPPPPPVPFPPRSLPSPLPQTMQLPVPPMTVAPVVPTTTPRLLEFETHSVDPVGPPPGTVITSEHFEYQSGRAESMSGQLEVSTIAYYASSRHAPHGSMIAVNHQFILYPTKNGLIRLIAQSSGERLLLRWHAGHEVVDLVFFGPQSDLCLSIGMDDKVVVFRVMIVNDSVVHEVLHEIHTQAQRAIWHPFDPNRIAIVSGGTVFVTSLNLIAGDSEAPTDMQPASVRCCQTDSQINDVVFSPCGRYLVTGGMDGFVHIYNIDSCAVGGSADLLHRFEPFDGGEVWAVRFYDNNAQRSSLLIGGELNSKLSLWDAPLVEDAQPTCVQTVKIASGDESSNNELDVVFDTSCQFLFVSDRNLPVLYVLHLEESTDNGSVRQFDNITEFCLTEPILSAVVLNRSVSSGAVMHVFTIQTQAIQRYFVLASRCYRPQTDDAGDEGDNEEVTHGISQSVGALTTEGETESTSFQAPAESPRASPETEVDVQTPQQNGDDESEYGSVPGRVSPPVSPRRTLLTGRAPHILTTHEDSSSVATDDVALSSIPRPYARSSPSSSVRAFHDDMSQLGEPSIDESIAGSDHVMAFLRRMEANQLQREERTREQLQKMMLGIGAQISAQASAQVEKTVQNQIQTILVPAMGRIVLHTMENNFMKPAQVGFERLISERLVPEMESKINASLENTLPSQMEDGVSDMVQRVVEDVREPVRESFKECFRDIIIPSFQAATQKMFEQIHEHVLAGATNSVQAGRHGSNVEIVGQLKQLVATVDALSRKVDQMCDSSSNGHIGESMSPEDRQLETHKIRVRELLAAKDYEEAFKYALGAQNVGLVTFTCQQVDVREVFSGRPLHLSQMIILCLVQQLGADLGTDLDLKLAWLREALLVMNPRDASISGFVSSVLQELQTSLNSIDEEDRDSQYTLIRHILNSLLSSC